MHKQIKNLERNFFEKKFLSNSLQKTFHIFSGASPSFLMPGRPTGARIWLRARPGRIIWVGIFLLFLFAGEVRADNLTGGISRVRVDDYVVLVRGGIIQSVKDLTINIWMLGLDADIRIGRNPPYFVPGEKRVPLPPRLPKEISLSLPSEKVPAKPASSIQDDLADPENSAPENVFILNLMNTNSMRVIVEGDAEIFRQLESSDAPEAQKVSAAQEEKGLESNQVSLKAPFPAGQEISRIQISSKYSRQDHFRFVVMGDSKDGLDIYKSILRKVRNIRPLFFAHLGDIVGGGTRREYQQILRLMFQVHFPFFISIGNNDALSQGLTVYHYWLGPTYYSFNYRNSHFVFLNDSSGLIDENQFRWLREDLQRNRSKKIFLFMHIPPYDPRQGRSYEITSSQNAGWLMDLASEFSVKRIYSSHINSYFKFTRRGTPIVITGGAGTRLMDKKSYHHFLLVTVKKDKVVERVIRTH